VVSASRDWETFTATRQTVIPASPRRGLPRPPLQLDPPAHGVYRRVLNRFFKEGRVASLDERLREIADRLIDEMAAPVAQIGAQYNEPYTVRALCALVGLDEAESAELGRLGRSYVDAIGRQASELAAELSAAVDDFAIRLVADRKVSPRDPVHDLATVLLNASAGDKPFSDEDVAGMIRLLLIGGHIVPRNFLGSAIVHLARDPGLQQRLRDEPASLHSAIEELLRLYSPNQALIRTTTREVSIGGQRIPADQPVALLFISANRDEAVFDSPDRFDAGRDATQHLAFGIGPHVCVAQFFARLECRIALAALLSRTASFELAGEPTRARWTEYGVQEAPIRWAPARTPMENRP
jgi:cytochrome P450